MFQLKDSWTEREFGLTLRFVLFMPSADWKKPSHIGESYLLYSVDQFKC